MLGFTIDQGAVPDSLDGDPAAADFRAGHAVHNLIELEAYGTGELSYQALEVLPNWKDEDGPRLPVYARVDGEIVGRAVYEVLLDDDDTAWFQIEVLPEFRHRGIGRALAAELEDRARAEGRSKLLLYAASPEAEAGGEGEGAGVGVGERLHTPTGFGSLPLANREVQCLLRAGYALEQIERASRLPLPVELDVAAAAERSGPDYRVHLWTGATPSEWLADLAILHTRMSTDAPSAGMEEPEDVYTPERVAQLEANEALSSRPMLVAVVEHIPTGTLAGFTQLSVAAALDRPIAQENTLVLREHRGHGLGVLLKLANLEYALAEHPGHPSVITYNAEENRHMLDVNEALGFVPIGYEGAWRKNLG
jgi:GNAT superfamily N-acetyltransferase